jgi:hypothetical protein
MRSFQEQAKNMEIDLNTRGFKELKKNYLTPLLYPCCSKSKGARGMEYFLHEEVEL